MPPAIITHPQNKTACQGSTATFTVEAVGSGTLGYQWQKKPAGGAWGNITGAMSSSFTTPVLTAQANGDRYQCIVTSAYGTVTSNSALLIVEECPTGLGTSPSGHYLTYGGQVVHLIGDNATQCMLQNKNMNYRQWIDDCYARGVKSIHMWGLLAARQKQDGSVKESRWGYVYPGLTPWARKTSGSLATDQLYQWDLKTFDESTGGYWQRLRDLCSYAREKGIVVGITPFFGWPKWNTVDRPDCSYHPFNTVNGGHVTDNNAVQTIATPGTEVWSQTWSDAWTTAKKTQWVWERYCKKLIDDCGSQGNVYFTFMDEHSYTEGNCGDHFRDFFRSRGMKWMDWSARRSTIDYVYSNTLSTVDKNSAAVSGFTSVPARPYFLLEGEPYSGTDFRTTFWTFQVGGGIYHYQSDSGQETETTGIMGYDPNVANSNRSAYLTRLSYLGHCSKLFNQHVTYLDQMVPSNGLCSSGIYALAYPGTEYVVYAKMGSTSTLTVNLSALTGTAVCRWYNPQTGVYGTAFNRAGGTTQSFTKPDSNDWALHITTVLDTQAPSVPTIVTATAVNAVSIQVSWTASTDNVGVTGYKIFRNGMQVGTSTTASYTSSGLSPQTTYSFTVSAYDGAGNNSAQSSPPAVATTSAGDGQAPSVPTNVAAAPQSTSSILVTWTASTDNVGVTGYKVFRNGTEVGTSSATSYTDSGLTAGTTYSYTVSAHDAAGNNSAESSPAALATTLTPVDIAVAKQQGNGETVCVTEKVVTASFQTYFYIEEPDRFAGIQVVPLQMPEELDINDLVNVSGVIKTLNGERYIDKAVVTSPAGSGSVTPIGVSNIGVGGGDWMYNSESGAGQRGIKDAIGPNKIGMLITTWGRFTYVDSSSFIVDDGSGRTVFCTSPIPERVTLNQNWQYVAVMGISSCEIGDAVLFRKVLVRDQNDIVPVQ